MPKRNIHKAHGCALYSLNLQVGLILLEVGSFSSRSKNSLWDVNCMIVYVTRNLNERWFATFGGSTTPKSNVAVSHDKSDPCGNYTIKQI